MLMKKTILSIIIGHKCVQKKSPNIWVREDASPKFEDLEEKYQVTNVVLFYVWKIGFWYNKLLAHSMVLKMAVETFGLILALMIEDYDRNCTVKLC